MTIKVVCQTSISTMQSRTSEFRNKVAMALLQIIAIWFLVNVAEHIKEKITAY